MSQSTTQQPIISFFDNVWSTQPSGAISIDEMVRYIKSITLENATYQIRNANIPTTDAMGNTQMVDAKEIKKAQNNLKKKLPAVTISGVVKGVRTDDNLEIYNRIVGVDIDDVPNVGEVLELVKADKHTLFAFISPRGNGVKAGVLVDGDNHAENFKAIEAYYKQTHNLTIDTACKNVARLTYLCHDADCFYNPTSTPLKPTLLAEPTPEKPTYLKPLNTNQNDVEALISELSQSHTDITGDYNQWLQIGFALATEYGEAGRGYYHSISAFSSLYDATATDKQYTACVRSNGNGVTIKTLFGFAKTNGIVIKPPMLTKQEYYLKKQAERDEQKKLEAKAKHEADKQTPGQDQVIAEDLENELITALPMNLEDLPNFDDYNYDEKKFFYTHNFFIKDGRYYVLDAKSHGDKCVSNFTMSKLYQFDDGSDNTKRLYKIQRADGRVFIKVLEDKNAITPSTFKTALLTVGCFFQGTESTLSFIQEYNEAGICKASEITTLGYNATGDFYALSDCIIKGATIQKVNDIGVIKTTAESYYLAPWAKNNLENAGYENDRKFRHIEGNLNFGQWAGFVEKSFGVKGMIGVLYTINCLFRDVCAKKHGFFPFLFLYGEAGVGKTSFVNLLLGLWGEDVNGHNANGSTMKGISRICGQRNNALTYIKEYDKNVQALFVSMFKNFYDGVAYTNAQTTNDNRTNSYKVTSGIVFDGNSLPISEPAFYDRFIVLDFETTTFSDEAKQAYDQFKDEVSKGLGRVLCEILAEREAYATQYKKVYHDTQQYLKNHPKYDLKGMRSRTFNHIAFLLTPLRMQYKNLHIPFNYAEVESKIIEDAFDKLAMMVELSDVNVFWDSVNHAKINGLIHDKIYILDPVDKLLFFKIKEFYPTYVNYCKKSSTNPLDYYSLLKLLTAPSYPFLPNTTQKRDGKAIKKAGLNSCYRFKIEVDGESKSIAGKELNL